jgi:hypothetical protein
LSKAGTPVSQEHPPPPLCPGAEGTWDYGIRQHDFRRTFIALHVEAGTHPKLVQDRVGHSDIKLTMDLYGRIAGKMTLAEEQEARLNALANKALPALSPIDRPAQSDTKATAGSGHTRQGLIPKAPPEIITSTGPSCFAHLLPAEFESRPGSMRRFPYARRLSATTGSQRATWSSSEDLAGLLLRLRSCSVT